MSDDEGFTNMMSDPSKTACIGCVMQCGEDDGQCVMLVDGGDDHDRDVHGGGGR